jgi:hypothetical protein
LAINNVLGQTVLKLVERKLKAGWHETLGHGKDLSGKAVYWSGYFCWRETMGQFKTTKLLMTK